nr:MAG TPA: hypothetical protein [Caudoviricetes sp.]
MKAGELYPAFFVATDARCPNRCLRLQIATMSCVQKIAPAYLWFEIIQCEV